MPSPALTSLETSVPAGGVSPESSSPSARGTRIDLDGVAKRYRVGEVTGDRAVSFVFQSFNLFPALTAQENVQFGADVAGADDPGTAIHEDPLRMDVPSALRILE